MHAHDAVRYVGDMLAWMHQAVASEEEFLESVFGDSGDEDPKIVNLAESSSSLGENSDVDASKSAMIGFTTQDLLARCLQGLGR